MHINHFLIYVVFGIIMPNRYILIVFISILWEIFETTLVHNNSLYEITKKYWFVEEKYWNEINNNKILDLIINLFGYFVGSTIRSYICK
jgi:hypothetical protein